MVTRNHKILPLSLFTSRQSKHHEMSLVKVHLRAPCRRFLLFPILQTMFISIQNTAMLRFLSPNPPHVPHQLQDIKYFPSCPIIDVPNRLSNCTSIFIDFTTVLSFRQAHSKYSAVFAGQHRCACLRTAGMRRAVPRRLQDHADTYRHFLPVVPRPDVQDCVNFFSIFRSARPSTTTPSVPRLSRTHYYAEFNFIAASSFICASIGYTASAAHHPQSRLALLKISRTVFPPLRSSTLLHTTDVSLFTTSSFVSTLPLPANLLTPRPSSNSATLCIIDRRPRCATSLAHAHHVYSPRTPLFTTPHLPAHSPEAFYTGRSSAVYLLEACLRALIWKRKAVRQRASRRRQTFRG